MIPEQLNMQSGDNMLEGLHFANPKAPLVLFCHGFPGVYKHLDLAENLHQAGFGVLVMKYSGVDSSTGYFNFTQAIKDVSETATFVSELDIDRKGIGVFGYSIGAYYALNAASENRSIRSVCALSPVTSLPRAARMEFQNIYDLMLEAQSLIRIRGVSDLVASFAEAWKDYNVMEKVKTIQDRPLLIIDGTDDVTGDPEQARLLYGAANEPKRLEWLGGAGHFFSSTDERSQLSDMLESFFRDTLMN